MKKTFLLLAFVALAVLSHAQISSVYTYQFQHLLDSLGKKYNIKSMSAAILIPNEGIWTGAYGVSYDNVPLTTNTYLPIGSNTKTFTAAVILKLQEQGLLNINDPISNWISDPNIDGNITVKQLLNHRSGLYDYTMNQDFFTALNADYNKVWQAEEMLQFLKPPVASPDDTGVYCNTNFMVLGLIIKKITGKEIHTAFQDIIFNEQGLNNTFFYPHTQPSDAIPHGWAAPTDPAEPMLDMMTIGYTNNAFLSMATTAGAVVSTAEDNVKFWDKLMKGKIINSTSLDMMRDAHAIDRGIVYGLGVMKTTTNGRTVFNHGGTCFGYVHENLYDSAKGVCITVSTNQDSIGNNELYNLVVRNLHRIIIKMPPTTVKENTIKPAIVNIYPNPATNTVKIDMGNIERASYQLADITGRIIKTGTAASGLNEVQLNDLAPAMYMIRVSNEDGLLYNARLIKQ